MLRHGTTLVGLLVAVVCLLVLSVVALNSINKAMTGAGSTLPGTARTLEDQQYLVSLFKSIAAGAQEYNGRFIDPGATSGRGVTDNTTASLFSLMIMQSYAVPGQLISAAEVNPLVWRDEDYNYAAHDPGAGILWDPSFVADLARESNDSFAHVPLYGERLREIWRFTGGSRAPLLGNRGPRDGLDDPSSYTFGRDGKWAGQIVFGDGHIEFTTTFTPTGLFFGPDGLPDNIFAMEEGPGGHDAILTFTREMTEDGPVVQYD